MQGSNSYDRIFIDAYKKSRNDFQFLLGEAFQVSSKTANVQLSSKKEEIAVVLFAKQVLDASAIKKLLPALEGKEIWFVPSVISLVRVMMETYYAFHHLCIENVSPEELAFRLALWKYHSESERLEMVKFINPKSDKIEAHQKLLSKLKQELENSSFFQHNIKIPKKDILKGESGFYLSTSERAFRAGIAKNYHKGVYKFLSNYVHTFGFSYIQMLSFNAGDEDSFNILRITIEWAVLFLAFCLRDYLILFPELGKNIDSRINEVIKKWDDILIGFDLFIKESKNNTN